MGAHPRPGCGPHPGGPVGAGPQDSRGLRCPGAAGAMAARKRRSGRGGFRSRPGQGGPARVARVPRGS
eukprot:11141749-Lingulodinium_polyedra.AAC.1